MTVPVTTFFPPSYPLPGMTATQEVLSDLGRPSVSIVARVDVEKHAKQLAYEIFEAEFEAARERELED